MDSSKEYRDNLIKIVRENVQICQMKFGGLTLLATENESSVSFKFGMLNIINITVTISCVDEGRQNY